MIKKLHYVWFGGKPLPNNVKSCIRSWRKFCPDWEIIQWDESTFDVHQYRWVREAIEARKYAFAADYVRLWVLKQYGGGYLDTDIQIVRSIDESIASSFVAGIENLLKGSETWEEMSRTPVMERKDIPCFGIQVGFMYAEPQHPFVERCMREIYSYGQKAFVNEDGSYNQIIIDGAIYDLLRRSYGLLIDDRTQHLPDDILIYDSSVYATRKTKNSNTYLIHWFDQSWKPATSLKSKLKSYIKRELYWLYRKQ